MADKTFQNSREFARKLDNEDGIHQFRERFIFPFQNGKNQIYFLGNSLGLQSRNISVEIKKILDEWGLLGVESFFLGNDPWINYHDRLTFPLSKLVGSLPSEITVMNQLTVNLHLMMVSFYQPAGKRTKILCEAKAFPSDQYMFETHVRQRGLDPDNVIIEVAPREGEYVIRTEDILNEIERNRDELALVLFSGVQYYSGQVFNIPAIVKASHDAGIMCGFDLSHAVGNINLELHNWDADFACWCSYKYLNSGPGAIGGVYIHERFHDDHRIHRFAGWWGHHKETRFKMEKGFQPIASAEGWQLSTPSILLYACHKAALDIFEEVGWHNLLSKQKTLTDFLWFVLDDALSSAERGRVELLTPRGENEHGCQVSMLIRQNGRKIFDGLSERGIMADWREPDVIRIAPVPMYNSFEDVWNFGSIFREVLAMLS